MHSWLLPLRGENDTLLSSAVFECFSSLKSYTPNICYYSWSFKQVAVDSRYTCDILQKWLVKPSKIRPIAGLRKRS